MPYIYDYPKNPELLPKICENWKISSTHKQQRGDWDYFNGDNVTIRNVKKYYWSNPKIVLDKNGQPVIGNDGQPKRFGGGVVENKYVANNHICYGIYKDIVSQKTNSLLNETPIVTGLKLDNKFEKQFGYAMKVGGQRAAGQGTNYIYQDFYGNLNVFNAENCIPYFDEMNGDLKALIRFWDIATADSYCTNGKSYAYYTIIETYTQEGMTVYTTRKQLQILRPTTPYKFSRTADALGETITGESIDLPITIFRNNKDYKSDMTPSVRAKIDSIDSVNSGFANNIEDFSELFWVIKNAGGMSEESFNDFVENINRTKKLVMNDGGSSVDTKQIEIPTEARTKFVEQMKKELIFETGIVDTQSIADSGDIRNIGIKLMTLKLQQRISDFEWEAYRAGTDIINKYMQYRGINAEFDIDFQKMLLGNDTEMIENANSIRADISQETYLKILRKAGYIQDVEEEKKQIVKEAQGMVKIVEVED